MDFFAVHQHWFWFMFFMTLFPRLTLLFTGICFFPWAHIVWFWVGWVIAPRLLTAILATTFYWNTNPVLCIFTWLWAFTVTSGETKAGKKVINKKVRWA